jgi:hypothetical protein
MKTRRLHGYPYRHNLHKAIVWWDTYGQSQFNSVTGGIWFLIPDEEIGLYLNSGCEI